MMKTKPPEPNTYAALLAFRKLLLERYGQPETYGCLFDTNGEVLSGATYRAYDLQTGFSFDRREDAQGRVTILYSRYDEGECGPSWLKIFSRKWNPDILPDRITAAAALVEPGVYTNYSNFSPACTT